MARYRAPPQSGSKFITPEGVRRLRAELDFLWRIQRPEVTRAVAEAAALGDRSENAEYIYGKRQLREIDRRVRYLRKRLEGMTIVDRPPADRSRIYFGAWVKLEDDRGRVMEYRIVGPDEFDAAEGSISMDSPLGRALLRRGLDDEITVALPAGTTTFVIVGIRYG